MVGPRLDESWRELLDSDPKPSGATAGKRAKIDPSEAIAWFNLGIGYTSNAALLPPCARINA